MAWNRPNEDKSATHTSDKRKRSCGKLLTIATFCIVAIIVTVLHFNDKMPWTDKGCQSRHQIANATPLRQAKTDKGSVFVAKRMPNKTKDVARPEVSHAEVFLKPQTQGRLVVWQTKNPPVFTNSFEGYVAGILTTEPGERILSTELPGDFEEAFKEAMSSKIVIGKDDSEEVAALKEAVIATKEEVRLRVAKGENPRDIIQDSLIELNKIADYRDQIQSAFNEYILKAETPKDLVEYEKEANAILAEYGALPIEGPHDEETAYEVMVEAKEDKMSELSKKLEK